MCMERYDTQNETGCLQPGRGGVRQACAVVSREDSMRARVVISWGKRGLKRYYNIRGIQKTIYPAEPFDCSHSPGNHWQCAVAGVRVRRLCFHRRCRTAAEYQSCRLINSWNASRNLLKPIGILSPPVNVTFQPYALMSPTLSTANLQT